MTNWKPSIKTGTHTPDGKNVLHRLLANREIHEGDAIINEEMYLDDRDFDQIRAGAKALGITLEWSCEIKLTAWKIDWSQYPARLQWPTEQSFLDHINEMISARIDAERSEDDDDEKWFEMAIDELGKIDELTPHELECEVIEAVAEARAQL